MPEPSPYKYGETNPVNLPLLETQQIDIGDLVGMSSGVLIRACDVAWTTNLADTQLAFHALYAGVAMQRSRANLDSDPVRVATEGVFDFACAAATFHTGDYVGPANNGGTALYQNQVVKVTTAGEAIGRVVKEYPSNTTTVRVRIAGSLTTDAGGTQLAATV
jgi:hypothetical protein